MKTALKVTVTGAASAVFLLGCANLGGNTNQPAQLQAPVGKALTTSVAVNNQEG